MKRLVQPELLDALPPDDPCAIRSRRDLRRINWWMGNQAIMTRALNNNLSAVPGRITELGAGDGDFLLRIAQKMSPLWPDVKAALLDRQQNISAQTLAAFAELGWRAEAVVADGFDWSPSGSADETVVANLFLHHFKDAQLAGLLHNISQCARLFVAIEPCRLVFPSLVGPLLRLIDCNYVTRHDAVVSIRAGFAGQEISALWPDQTNWQLAEHRAGLFSHLFIARRRE
jgi:hypothetical protein